MHKTQISLQSFETPLLSTGARSHWHELILESVVYIFGIYIRKEVCLHKRYARERGKR